MKGEHFKSFNSFAMSKCFFQNAYILWYLFQGVIVILSSIFFDSILSLTRKFFMESISKSNMRYMIGESSSIGWEDVNAFGADVQDDEEKSLSLASADLEPIRINIIVSIFNNFF